MEAYWQAMESSFTGCIDFPERMSVVSCTKERGASNALPLFRPGLYETEINPCESEKTVTM
jgi:hypothetical protein